MRISEIVERTSLLIIVHPGSACGSADFNLGKSYASTMRDFLQNDIEQWFGEVLIIDNEFSDELPSNPNFNNTILSKNPKRIMAGDHQGNWTDIVKKYMSKIPRTTRIELTGIWYYPENGGGCVGAVYDTIKSLGFSVNIRDSVITDDDGDDHVSS